MRKDWTKTNSRLKEGQPLVCTVACPLVRVPNSKGPVQRLLFFPLSFPSLPPFLREFCGFVLSYARNRDSFLFTVRACRRHRNVLFRFFVSRDSPCSKHFSIPPMTEPVQPFALAEASTRLSQEQKLWRDVGRKFSCTVLERRKKTNLRKKCGWRPGKQVRASETTYGDGEPSLCAPRHPRRRQEAPQKRPMA